MEWFLVISFFVFWYYLNEISSRIGKIEDSLEQLVTKKDLKEDLNEIHERLSRIEYRTELRD